MLTTTATNSSQSTHSRRHVSQSLITTKLMSMELDNCYEGAVHGRLFVSVKLQAPSVFVAFPTSIAWKKNPPKNTANKLHCSCSAWDHIHVATSGVHSSFKRVRCISCCHKCSICTTAGSTAILAGVKQEVRGIGVVHRLPLGSCSGCNRLLISHRALQQMPAVSSNLWETVKRPIKACAQKDLRLYKYLDSLLF